MTFEEWAETTGMNNCEYSYANLAWEAAKQAERERILQIVTEVADDFMHDPWVWACEEIEKRINAINKCGE